MQSVSHLEGFHNHLYRLSSLATYVAPFLLCSVSYYYYLCPKALNNHSITFRLTTVLLFPRKFRAASKELNSADVDTLLSVNIVIVLHQQGIPNKVLLCTQYLFSPFASVSSTILFAIPTPPFLSYVLDRIEGAVNQRHY